MWNRLVVLFGLIMIGSACLITNCPRGGKRGGNIVSENSLMRECPSCGPNHLGQCFGPRICCGPSIGCFFGTAETLNCRKESLYTKPCIAGYAMCRGNTARCAADGICCSQESCQMDFSCRLPDSTRNTNRKIGADLDIVLSDDDLSKEIIQ